MAAVARQNTLCCCKCVALHMLQEYKLLTRILTAVLLMPIWGWGFFCKGWELLPSQMMPSHITAVYLAACISIIFTFSVPWGLSNIQGEKHHCRLYLLHCPSLLPPPLPLPPVILFEEGRIEFWLRCCRNCTASALLCQHVMYGLGWKRL